MKSVAIIGAVLLSSGCSELFLAVSPLHRDQPLAIEEREDPGRSLALGSVRFESGAPQLDEVSLIRRSPGPRAQMLISNAELFRVLRSRHIRDGLFVAPNLPAGVYQLGWLRRGLKTWYAPKDSDVMRIEISDAAIYDAGAWIARDDGSIVADPRPDQLSRYGQVLDAARGTAWEDPLERLRNKVARPPDPQ